MYIGMLWLERTAVQACWLWYQQDETVQQDVVLQMQDSAEPTHDRAQSLVTSLFTVLPIEEKL